MFIQKSSTTTPQNFPQEPMPPYPYLTEDVIYENTPAGVKLAGTLTLPQITMKGKTVPAVLLIAGYGPNDRNYTLLGHKRFMVVADHLTRCGFAVLRFDKRGVGKSTGSYKKSTSRDFADDAIFSLQYLKTRKEIDINKIGLIGHSEGGMIATMVAANNTDVAFVVLMASAIQTDVHNLVKQTASQLRADGATEELIEKDSKLRTTFIELVKNEPDPIIAKVQLEHLIEKHWELLPEKLKIEADKIPFAVSKAKTIGVIYVFNSPWYRYFYACKPIEILKQVQAPILALYGNKDWIASSQPSLKIISEALTQTGHKDFYTVELQNVNHSLQTCKTGALAEYGTIQETIAPTVLTLMSDWILKKLSK